jgi:cyclohexanecarboxylate-CoA ligase
MWDAHLAADLIEREGVTFTMAALPFLVDLNEVAVTRAEAFGTLRTFLCAGAPIPRALIPLASSRLGAAIISGWGMTEVGAVTVAARDDPLDAISSTDGRPLPGVWLRVVDAGGDAVPNGAEGRLQVRGCSLFGGYLKRPELKILEDGWFDTGDYARLDDAGYVRITGRAKDIIIRGGENIPVVEIEGLLAQHPDVLAAAIVGVPDPRLGERALAFVVSRPASSPTMHGLLDFLAEKQVARQYLPEHIEVVDDLPRTATGKVTKFKLREWAREIEPAWLTRP